MAKDKIFIVIAHRLDTVKNSNEILVLDHGQIVESGSYDSLLQLNGRFSELVNASKNGKLYS